MAFCSKCGAQIPDNTLFCMNCGTKVSDTGAAPQYNPYQPNDSAQPVYAPPVQNSVARTSPVEVVRSFAKAPLFIVAILAFTLNAIFGFIQMISDNVSTFGPVQDLVSDLLGNDGAEIVSATEGVSIFSGVLSSIPGILTAIGLWLIFVAALNRNDSTLRTGGLTMIKVVMIIELVFICIAVALVIGVLVLIMVFGASTIGDVNEVLEGFSDFAYGLLIGILAVVVIAAVFVILFLAKILTSIAAAKRTLATGAASDKVSAFVAVMLFMAAVGNLISVFSSEDIVAASPGLLGAVSSVCFGILIFQYRAAMRPLMYGNTNPGMPYYG